jgi:hypothetical protein
MSVSDKPVRRSDAEPDEAGQSKEVNDACNGSQGYRAKAALAFRFFEAFSDRKR